MEDWERELLIIEMQEECQEYDQKSQAEINKNPVWWNIHLGLIESTEPQRVKAEKIFREFVKWSEFSDLNICQRFKKFEQFKLYGGKAQ